MQNEPEENELYRDLVQFLKTQGHLKFRIMPDGSLLTIHDFLFTYGLCTGADWHTAYIKRWCYPKDDPLAVTMAFALYDGQGDPDGPWIKYKGIGPERHNPLLFDLIGGSHYVRKRPEQINEAALWPRRLPIAV